MYKNVQSRLLISSRSLPDFPKLFPKLGSSKLGLNDKEPRVRSADVTRIPILNRISVPPVLC